MGLLGKATQPRVKSLSSGSLASSHPYTVTILTGGVQVSNPIRLTLVFSKANERLEKRYICSTRRRTEIQLLRPGLDLWLWSPCCLPGHRKAHVALYQRRSVPGAERAGNLLLCKAKMNSFFLNPLRAY